MEAVPFQNIEMLLTWVISGMGGIAIAHFLERMGFFKSLQPQQRFWFVLLLSIVLPVAGIYVKTMLYGEPIDLDVAFRAVQAAIVMFASSQYAYTTQVKVVENEK